jgi:hypothetical protein
MPTETSAAIQRLVLMSREKVVKEGLLVIQVVMAAAEKEACLPAASGHFQISLPLILPVKMVPTAVVAAATPELAATVLMVAAVAAVEMTILFAELDPVSMAVLAVLAVVQVPVSLVLYLAVAAVLPLLAAGPAVPDAVPSTFSKPWTTHSSTVPVLLSTLSSGTANPRGNHRKISNWWNYPKASVSVGRMLTVILWRLKSQKQ